jgi:3-deoxy-D-manno-octulosonic-acid transferase
VIAEVHEGPMESALAQLIGFPWARRTRSAAPWVGEANDCALRVPMGRLCFAPMRWFTALLIYRLLLPLFFLAAFPGWIVKMLRRGGFGTRLAERIGVYTTACEFEPCGAVHVHAISVGESMLALKLIREWLVVEPGRRFVLATGTATGHAVATSAAIPELRITYSPLDFPSMVNRYLKRFEPSQIVLVEGEAWPHLLLACKRRKIPVALVNARMSPRSARRYRRFAPWVSPVFSMLDAVAIQEPQDAEIWQDLAVDSGKIHHTGSLKLDPGSGARPVMRPEFQEMLAAFGNHRAIVLAASTHVGEEVWIANAIHQVSPNALPVIVPRHAERRNDVKNDLEHAGFEVVLRSRFQLDRQQGATVEESVRPLSAPDRPRIFLIDSTGELRDWTAHADVVIIGKSFRSVGGQNPAEAILAGKPVVFGPHMENFEPLASRLVSTHGAILAHDENALCSAITKALDPTSAESMTRSASLLLAPHQGATRRMIELLTAFHPPEN